uniref:Uncharacterized protein n=1 Tax=Arundo donax TaxID=35708 RepID=A0A0A9AVI9_ARUDO
MCCLSLMLTITLSLLVTTTYEPNHVA